MASHRNSTAPQNSIDETQGAPLPQPLTPLCWADLEPSCSNRAGCAAGFLDVRVKLSAHNESLTPMATIPVLACEHFSVLLHAQRESAFWTASKVDGAPLTPHAAERIGGNGTPPAYLPHPAASHVPMRTANRRRHRQAKAQSARCGWRTCRGAASVLSAVCVDARLSALPVGIAPAKPSCGATAS